MTKKTKIAFIILGLVIVIMAAVIIVMILRKDTAEAEEKEKRNTVVTKENVDDVIDEMTKQAFVPPGYYNVKMNTDWYFKDGSAASENSYVANDASNSNDVYFDLILGEDESQIIYKSPIIPRGSELRDVVLDKKLEKGEYKCGMIYHLIDDDQNTVSTLRVRCNLIIEN